jgi:PAS domain S-box-containing protein
VAASAAASQEHSLSPAKPGDNRHAGSTMYEPDTWKTKNRLKSSRRNSAELLRGQPADMLLNRLDTATIVVALDGTVVYANPACERLLGYHTSGTLEGQSLPSLLVRQAETPANACIEMLRDPDTVTNWNHSDGYPIATLASDPMLFDSTETMLMVSLTDVSDRVWNAVDRAKHFSS